MNLRERLSTWLAKRAARHEWFNAEPDSRLPCTWFQECRKCGQDREYADEQCPQTPSRIEAQSA